MEIEACLDELALNSYLQPDYEIGSFLKSTRGFSYLQGAHSSGRTEFIYQIILSVILPPTWGPIPIGGMGSGAIYFDLDLKFNLQRFLELTKLKFLEKVKGYENVSGLEDISEVIQKSFSRLHIIKIRDQLQLTITLRNIATQTNSIFNNLKLIALDSLDCFYYPENQAHFFHKTINLSELCISLLKKLQIYRSIFIVATVSMLYKITDTQSSQLLQFQKGSLLHFQGDEKIFYTTDVVHRGYIIIGKKS